jgi:hypothetical protein
MELELIRMSTNRRTAIAVGVLYIIGTVAGILSVVFTGPILEEPETLQAVAQEVTANEDQLVLGALSVMTMGLALAMIPVVIYPILKRHSEVLATGYLVFRGALEAFGYLVIVLSWLLLITFSQEYVDAGTPADLELTGNLLLDAGDWIGDVLTIVFIIGALMFYTVLFQSKLVPRWLSGWGLIAAVPSITSGILGLFSVIEPFSTTQLLMEAPLGVQEMVLALWLIIRGFNASALSLPQRNPAQ